MTTITLSHTSAAPSETGIAGLFVLARRLHTSMARRAAIRKDRRALRAMPDHILRDIGISRGEIDSAIEFGRYRGAKS